ncbi:hypothetical protein D3C80_1719020 [compost metagenome]
MRRSTFVLLQSGRVIYGRSRELNQGGTAFLGVFVSHDVQPVDLVAVIVRHIADPQPTIRVLTKLTAFFFGGITAVEVDHADHLLAQQHFLRHQGKPFGNRGPLPISECLGTLVGHVTGAEAVGGWCRFCAG